jgi:hypothetical protein
VQNERRSHGHITSLSPYLGFRDSPGIPAVLCYLLLRSDEKNVELVIQVVKRDSGKLSATGSLIPHVSKT